MVSNVVAMIVVKPTYPSADTLNSDPVSNKMVKTIATNNTLNAYMSSRLHLDNVKRQGEIHTNTQM